jgi:hypothetical protein
MIHSQKKCLRTNLSGAHWLDIRIIFLPHFFSKKNEATKRHYEQALSLLAKNGIHRQLWQRAQAFSISVSEQLEPKAGQIFRRLSDVYQRLEYQAKPLGAQQNVTSKECCLPS